MRFMMFMLPNIDPEAGWMPSAEAVAEMSRYNQELEAAGARLDANGLHPETESVRVTHAGGKPDVTDGPFTETKEMIGGYWIIQAKSKDEAIEWAKRVPSVQGDPFTIELRQIIEIEEFPPDVQTAARS